MPLPVDETGKPKRGPGRPKGSPNKATRAVKEFLMELCDDPKVQKAIKDKIVAGDNLGFFRALDKILPDPPRKYDVDLTAEWVMTLPPGDDVGTGD